MTKKGNGGVGFVIGRGGDGKGEESDGEYMGGIRSILSLSDKIERIVSAEGVFRIPGNRLPSWCVCDVWHYP